MVRLKSEAQYQRAANRLLTRSRKPQFAAETALQSLINEAQMSGPVRGSTLRSYRAGYKRALEMLGSLDVEGDLSAIEAGLEERRKHVKVLGKRTSALMGKDVTQAEAAATFGYLKQLALRTAGVTAMAAVLYTLVMPHIALRPVELLSAEVRGQFLIVRNAKAKSGQLQYRRLSLKRFARTFVEALRWLCVLAQQGVERSNGSDEEEKFIAWRNRLARCLADASKRACGRRLALYAFRHIGIATWKASGFSKAEIAYLSGHLKLDTAAKHYAAGRHGWRVGAMLALPAPVAAILPRPVTTAPATRPSDAPSTEQTVAVIAPTASSNLRTARVDALVFERMPTPATKSEAQAPKLDGNSQFESKANAIAWHIEGLVRKGKPLAEVASEEPYYGPTDGS